MQLLQLTRRITVFCGICSTSKADDSSPQFGQTVRIVICAMNIFLLGSFSAYYAGFQPSNGEITEFLFGILSAVPCCIQLGSFLTLVHHQKDVRAIFQELQEKFDQCKDTAFDRIYLRVNELCETFLKVALIMMQMMYVGMTVVFIAVGALYYYIHDEAVNLYTPLRTM